MASKLAMKKSKSKTKPKAKKQYKKSANVSDYASLSCKTTIVPSGATVYSANTLYNKIDTSLSQFPRAVLVAQGYQHYKISKIAMTFKPTLDSFVPNQVPSATYSKPYLYSMIDKSGSIPTTVTLEALKNMGCRPRALDEKPLVVTWSPSVLTTELTAASPASSAASAYRISPWLSTNATVGSASVWTPSSVDHYGLYWYADSVLGGQSIQYQIEIEVQFQFKKPYFSIVAGPSAIGSVQLALDNSSDGIADGRHYGVQTGTQVTVLN